MFPSTSSRETLRFSRPVLSVKCIFINKHLTIPNELKNNQKEKISVVKQKMHITTSEYQTVNLVSMNYDRSKEMKEMLTKII